MEIPVSIVETILKKAVKKGKVTSDRIGLHSLPELLNKELPPEYKLIGERYIYDTLYLSVEKAKKDQRSTIHADQSCLDSICFFLGFQNLETYRQMENPFLPPGVFSIVGNWYSIVRCNSGLPDLLLSPVKIRIVENNTAALELKGPHRTYQGKIKWIGGSISSHLVSRDQAKTLHLAFNIGVAKKPQLLLGVFSGVSSGGKPIAGREILLRIEEDYEKMKNKKLRMSSIPADSSFTIPDPILKYFADFKSCYFKVTDASTFDLNDL